jgi:hypothetical protein
VQGTAGGAPPLTPGVSFQGLTMNLEKEFENNFKQILNDLKGESERGVVIVIASHLDVRLEDLLKTALTPSPTATDMMFDGPNALLQSFSNKIDFCYRLGLLSSFATRSLHLIRKIRNKFAHNISSICFNEPDIESQVSELYKMHMFDKKQAIVKEIFNETKKSQFILSAILVLGIINEIYCKVASNNPHKPEWPYEWLLQKANQ